jgi:hypothetical protein
MSISGQQTIQKEQQKSNLLMPYNQLEFVEANEWYMKYAWFVMSDSDAT